MPDKAERDIEIRQPHTTELGKVRALRRVELLGEEASKSDYEPTPDDLKSSAIHVVAFDGDKVVSAVRVDPVVGRDDTFLVTRMVTSEIYRGQGIGAKVLLFAEDIAKQAGAKYFMLDSRPKAEQFYARMGYNRSDSTAPFVVQDVLMTKCVV